MHNKKLAVCAIFENEARLLPEWLAHHHLVGVEHFVLYDNGSTDQSAQVIHDSPVALHVTLIRWPQKPGRLAAYRHFIDIFAPGFDWVAFIDVDQFLLPLSSHSVTDTLDWLSNAAAVLVHRRVFAQGDWPAGNLAIEAFRRRAADAFPAHHHARTIARCTELLDVAQQPYEFRLNGPAFNTAGHLAPNRAALDQPCFQNLVINQYCPRPGAEALAKLLEPSSEAPSPTDDVLRAALSEQEDDAIQAFAPAVRHLLGLEARVPAPAEATTFEPVVAKPIVPVATPPVPTPPDVQPEIPVPPVPPAQTPAEPWLAYELPEAFANSAPADALAGSAPPDALAEASPSNTWAAAAPAPEPDLPVWEQPPSAVPPEPGSAASASPAQGQIAPGWTAVAPEGQVRTGGLALVFRDRSRSGEIWLAALRGAAANAIDPAFLTDEFDRIQDFPTDAAARAACDAALAKGHRA